MARYEIVLDDADRDTEDAPFHAGLWQMDEYGRSGDLLEAGEGSCPATALIDLLQRAARVNGTAWDALTSDAR